MNIMKKNPLRTYDYFRERVNSQLDLFLGSIKSTKNSKNQLKDVMRYSALAGGKRFRPILTYTVASLYDLAIEKVDSSACAIELIHIYSLIHDDLPAMDDDDIRHNQPTSHKVFGEAQAILAGDGLQALAFKVICSDPLLDSEIKIKLLSLLSESSYNMAEGQSIDLSIVSQSVDISLLNEMHNMKTGALLDCAVKFGAILNNSIDEDLSILDSFSSKVGLAYQVQDDVLDVTTVDEVLGKRQNSDSNKNKPSYPSIIGIDESIKIFKELYKEALDEISYLSVDAESLRTITRELMSRNH